MPSVEQSASPRPASGKTAAGRHNQDLAGTQVGNYQLVSMLGVGGLGSVWLAEHPGIGSKVAVKVLHPEVQCSDEATRRFELEARVVNRVHSRHVVRTFDFGALSDGREYAVMELLDGSTLAQRLAEGPLPWRCVRSIALQMLEALGSTHDAGVVHRDLKPENVHLGPNPDVPEVKLLDFGIAKVLDSDTEVAPLQTQAGLCVGTPIYAAPEQLTGEAITPAVDVYGLGEILYEMLVGHPPFVGSLKEVVRAKVSRTPESIGALHPDLPAELVTLIDAMLAANPAQRPSVTQALVVLARIPVEAPIRPMAFENARHGQLEELAACRADTVPSPPPFEIIAQLDIAEPGIAQLGIAPPEPGELDLFREDRQWGAAPDPGDPPARPLAAPKKRRVRSPWVVLLPCLIGVGVAALAVTAWLLVNLFAAERSAVAQTPPPPTPVQSAKPAAPIPAQEAAPKEVEPKEVAPKRSVVKPVRHLVRLTSSPKGALVLIEGRKAGTTPLEVRLPAASTPVEITFHKPGYNRARRFVRVDKVTSVRVRLKRSVDWVDPF